MQGFMLAVLGLSLGADPVELPKDVHELNTRGFLLPLNVDPKLQDEFERVRLFVSKDQGKTWNHERDCKPSDKRVVFLADHDGHYWFAIQTHLKNGTYVPAKLSELSPAAKVYINTERKALKVAKSYEDLQREVEELRRTVERLQAKISALEAERNRK